ncbi:MAG: phosphocholine cytidylyltransferase family protein [Myxococcales bacterium]|nr:phosphocholine cytidylyltransferase family protein [Myxococcales bacterium]MCB9523188.1 phosphocholine cytidylyltransferase family protein [Myxococcales bacterium]
MKAIIIAAGQGKRLRPHTDHKAKTMVEINGRALLHRQVDALRAAGVDDIVVIRGYKAGTVQADGVRYIENADFANNNILESLMCAGDELVGDVIVSYGDIFYRPEIAAALARSYLPGTLVVDRAWADVYDGRDDHPVAQAELCELSEFGLVTRVGKQVGPENAFGEFIGLARFSAPLLARLMARYLLARGRGLDVPFGSAPSLRQAYLTDLINDGIAHGESIGVLATDGGWREIDTVQDYERAQGTIRW